MFLFPGRPTESTEGTIMTSIRDADDGLRAIVVHAINDIDRLSFYAGGEHDGARDLLLEDEVEDGDGKAG